LHQGLGDGCGKVTFHDPLGGVAVDVTVAVRDHEPDGFVVAVGAAVEVAVDDGFTVVVAVDVAVGIAADVAFAEPDPVGMTATSGALASGSRAQPAAIGSPIASRIRPLNLSTPTGLLARQGGVKGQERKIRPRFGPAGTGRVCRS
jgi:hypothetical protein